jgi:hypothetical protein
MGVDFGDQFLGRRQTVCSDQDRFYLCPIDLRRIQPQSYPAEMTDEFWDVKSSRGAFHQPLSDPAGSLAVDGKTSIAVMVIEVPAEALFLYFEAQVIAGCFYDCLRKAFDNCDEPRAPLSSYFLRNFDWLTGSTFFHNFLSLPGDFPTIMYSIGCGANLFRKWLAKAPVK